MKVYLLLSYLSPLLSFIYTHDHLDSLFMLHKGLDYSL